MHLLSSVPYFASILGLSEGVIMGLLIPLAGIVLAGVVTVSAMFFHNRRRELWHETARIALEKGQPLPPMNPDAEDAAQPRHQPRGANNDVRGGLVLIAVGAGLWLFLGGIAGDLRYVGAIPGFIGVALLLYAIVAGLFGRKDQPPKS